MYAFCTYFDINYLPRGLALHQSLQRHVSAFRLFVACLDQECYNRLQELQLANVELILIDELEREDPALRWAKSNRSRIEYYFTCTPAIPLYVLEHFPEVDLITYIDADMFFFSDPAAVFEEVTDASVVIVSHRYTPQAQKLNAYGIYNVGWLSFRRDANGLACLRWWRERCIEWCYDRLEGNRYADQKYLEQMPELFQGVVALQHVGVNTAPWNLMNYRFSLRDGQVYVDDVPLVIFHFHGFKQKLGWLFDTHTARYAARLSPLVREYVYNAYVRTLIPLLQQNQLAAGIRVTQAQRSGWQLMGRVYRVLHYLFGIVIGQYLVYGSGVQRVAIAFYQLIAAVIPHMAMLGPIWSLQAAEIMQFI